MFRNLGTTEIIVIAVVVLVLFGGKKLPELTKGIVQAIKEFRKSFKDNDQEENDDEK